MAGRRIAEPPPNLDGTSPGDSIIGGGPGKASFYRNTTSWGQPRPGLAAYDPQPAAAPSEPPLPMLNVARAVVAREAARLRGEAAGLERDLQRGVVGANGGIVPHLLERQREARAALVALEDEIRRIEGLDDEAIRRLARELGAR
jgi:hypothetical protein